MKNRYIRLPIEKIIKSKLVYCARFFVMIVFVYGLAACQEAADSFKEPMNQGVSLDSTKAPLSNPISKFTAYLPVLRTSSPGESLYLSPELPEDLANRIELLPGYVVTSTLKENNLRMSINEGQLVGYWVFAVVRPFPALDEGVSIDELLDAWHGLGQPLLMADETFQSLNALWGTSAENAVILVDENNLLNTAWQDFSSWAIVPFEKLEPRWRVMTVDGKSPLQNDFTPDSYALSAPIGILGDEKYVQGLFDLLALQPNITTNRDPSKLTTLSMTGVTALVRATAATMESQGMVYPARDIGGILRSSDLTHISNEVAFAEDCPAPNPYQEGVVFCSRDSYVDLLADVGTDIVELSGDHFQDWGAQAVNHTLELYRQNGWVYYGGGENLNEGRRALLMENNGNKLAFIGCNAKGAAFAHASDENPGAVTCDFDWMEQEISRLSSENYLVIATFQHFEYYTYQPQPNQIEDFGRLAEAGAVIVSGSQAHQPQGMAFFERQGRTSFIHYGLGNLFFDQYDLSEACRQAFIDRHVFYDGHYLGVELIPILFEDYARARPMNPDEANDLFRSVFSASGW